MNNLGIHGEKTPAFVVFDERAKVKFPQETRAQKVSSLTDVCCSCVSTVLKIQT